MNSRAFLAAVLFIGISSASCPKTWLGVVQQLYVYTVHVCVYTMHVHVCVCVCVYTMCACRACVCV